MQGQNTMSTQSQGETLVSRTYCEEWVCIQIPSYLWDSSWSLGR